MTGIGCPLVEEEQRPLESVPVVPLCCSCAGVESVVLPCASTTPPHASTIARAMASTRTIRLMRVPPHVLRCRSKKLPLTRQRGEEAHGSGLKHDRMAGLLIHECLSGRGAGYKLVFKPRPISLSYGQRICVYIAGVLVCERKDELCDVKVACALHHVEQRGVVRERHERYFLAAANDVQGPGARSVYRIGRRDTNGQERRDRHRRQQ